MPVLADLKWRKRDEVATIPATVLRSEAVWPRVVWTIDELLRPATSRSDNTFSRIPELVTVEEWDIREWKVLPAKASDIKVPVWHVAPALGWLPGLRYGVNQLPCKSVPCHPYKFPVRFDTWFQVAGACWSLSMSFAELPF